MRLVQARLTSTEAAYHEALNAAQRRPPALAEGPYPDGAHPAGQQSASFYDARPQAALTVREAA